MDRPCRQPVLRLLKVGAVQPVCDGQGPLLSGALAHCNQWQLQPLLTPPDSEVP